jgi:tetratricopeptide (TPR) repeat protein
MKRPLLFLALAAALLLAGCGPRGKNVTVRQRKEAAALVSEAQFAVSLRDFARAEPLLAQASQLCPDNTDYWISLGIVRRRLNNSSGAKTAYQEALASAKDAFKVDSSHPERLIQQAYILALLGRVDEARVLLTKAQQKNPDNLPLRTFMEKKELDRMTADPEFKEVAL